MSEKSLESKKIKVLINKFKNKISRSDIPSSPKRLQKRKIGKEDFLACVTEEHMKELRNFMKKDILETFEKLSPFEWPDVQLKGV